MNPPRLPYVPLPRLDWDADRRRLTMAFVLYLIMWIGGIAVWFCGMTLRSDELMNIGGFLFFGSILPYIAAVVFAYIVQDKLHKSGLYKGGAWQIVVGAVILNPYALGFVIPTSVLLASGKIDRQQRPRRGG
jgi:hypothetical protein